VTKVMIVGNGLKASVRAAVDELKPLLQQKVEVVRVDLTLEDDLSATKADLAVVFGGDGTILSVVRRLRGNQLPLVGVNFGKFGFLAGLSPEEFMQKADDIFSGRFPVQRRMLMACRIVSGEQVRWQEHALNDVVITRTSPARMLVVDVEVDGEHVTTYMGDGIVVSTPTGSTAHSLSTGGPVINPAVSAFVIGPVCAHSLAARHLVVSDRSKIEISFPKGDNRGPVTMAKDGRDLGLLAAGERVRLARSDVDCMLIAASSRSYYQTLREKLLWGGHVAMEERPS